MSIVGASCRHFALVFVCPVIVQNKSINLLVEKIVIVRATEVSPASEIMKTNPANGARLLVEFLKFLGGFVERHLLGQSLRKSRHQTSRQVPLRVGASEILFGMLLTKMEFLCFGTC